MSSLKRWLQTGHPVATAEDRHCFCENPEFPGKFQTDWLSLFIVSAWVCGENFFWRSSLNKRLLLESDWTEGED